MGYLQRTTQPLDISVYAHLYRIPHTTAIRPTRKPLIFTNVFKEEAKEKLFRTTNKHHKIQNVQTK